MECEWSRWSCNGVGVELKWSWSGAELEWSRVVVGWSGVVMKLEWSCRGKARTYKEYLVDMILDTIDNRGWMANLSKGRIEELKASFKGKCKK